MEKNEKNQSFSDDQNESVLHQFEEKDKSWANAILAALVIFVVIIGGVLTGYLFAKGGKGKTGPKSLKKAGGKVQVVKGKKEVGIKDPEVFRDTTEGRLEVNDFSKVKEGSHKLIRVGGEDKTAYLTSTVVDLNEYTGQCVQVWGETFSAKEAGWLMDVGRIKILDKCPQGL